jgi:leucyl-tRNA synthetase
MAADGTKMSKSRGNTVPSSDVVNRSGADACRLAILYLGPWEQSANWSEDTLRGVERFLKRVENLSDNLTDEPMTADQERLQHKLIADATERLEDMKFNTTISAMMEYINAFGGKMPRPAYETLLQMLNPFAPHLTEEMWEKLGHNDMLVFEPWPTFDVSKMVETQMTIVVSVNGKRATDFVVAADASEDVIVEYAKTAAGTKLDGCEVIKTIVVPKKLVNFVVKK